MFLIFLFFNKLETAESKRKQVTCVTLSTIFQGKARVQNSLGQLSPRMVPGIQLGVKSTGR